MFYMPPVKIRQTANQVLIYRDCTISKVRYEIKVPRYAWEAWQKGTLIQEAMPGLTAEEREFLISNHTPSEWNFYIGE